MIRTVLALSALFMLASCATPEQLAAFQAEQDNKATQKAAALAKADKVRLISPEQTKKCTYINQVSATAGLSYFGGMPATEKKAMQRLKIEAAKHDANGVRIADRMLDKGRGGADQTRITLYGDIYKCSGW